MFKQGVGQVRGDVIPGFARFRAVKEKIPLFIDKPLKDGYECPRDEAEEDFLPKSRTPLPFKDPSAASNRKKSFIDQILRV